MIGDLLGELTRRRLTSVHEIADVAQRGESTVYRWINNESQPDYIAIRRLAVGLENAEARRRVLGHFADPLPAAIVWTDDEAFTGRPGDETDSIEIGRLASCVQAIGRAGETIGALIECLERSGLERANATDAEHTLNTAIEMLVACRMRLTTIADPDSNGLAEDRPSPP